MNLKNNIHSLCSYNIFTIHTRINIISSEIFFIITLIIIIHYIPIFIKGFTGKDCDKAVVPCDENPCQNGAVCLLEDDHTVCYCVPDYHGALCELKYDDCESKFAQCDNGGTCIDGINSFTCACLPNYSGSMCEYSFPLTTISIEVEDISEQRTSSIKTTTAIVSPRVSTLITDTSVSLSSTSNLVTYSTTARITSSLYTKSYTMEKTTTMSGYEDGSSPGSESGVFLTQVPSTDFTTSKDATRDDVATPEVATISSTAAEGFSYVTEIESTEIYPPTGRSIHDGKVTKDDDRTTYSPVSGRVDEDLTRVTEYMTSFR